MSCEQWSDKDNAFIKDSMRDTNVPYGETIIVKRFDGFDSPGDPARGIQPVLKFVKVPVKAVITNISQQDIMYSGGLYQTGDIKLDTTEQLNYIDTIQQTGGTSQGDRVVWEGHEYRVVGKFDSHNFIGNIRLYSYVLRKVGNA